MRAKRLVVWSVVIAPRQQSARRIEEPLRLPTLAQVVDMPQRGDHPLADLRAWLQVSPKK
jgi:hypothetical protein